MTNPCILLIDDSLRVLILEDSRQDTELMVLQLREDGLKFDWQRVQTEEAYLSALRERPDVILADWQLPRFSGERALELRRRQAPDIPFIIVSGGIGEEAAVAALHAGASDYVLKDRPARLAAAVRRSLAERRLSQAHAQTRQRLQLIERAFQNTTEGLMITDAETRILSVNPAFEAITGYSAEHAWGRTPSLLKSGRHSHDFYRQLWQSLLESGYWRGEIWNRRCNGDIYPQWLSISLVRQVSGAISHFVGVFSDLTQIKQARERIEFLAWHDALTTLPNRAYLIEHLHHALYQQTAEPPTHALLLIGLDRFKTITETLGPVVGDQLLIETAERLRWAGAGFLARLGGDTFALFMAMPDGQAQATAVARELLTRLSQPFEIATRRLILTASIGIGLTHGEARDAEALIGHAERAMYEAKQRGRNHMYFYTPELTEGAVERLWLETALRRAVGYQRIQLYYQPQFDLNTGRLVGLEALARWEHPELGRIPPARFIPLAEEIGLITEIDVWMLGQACRQLADWDARGFHVPRVAVNFSVLDIVREGLVDKVRDALSAHALDPRRLELEVTESILVQDSARIRATLATLTASGCALAIDDFGTGYSNLGYLKLLPLTRLKIDRSFVCDIERDGNNEAIVRAMIALANSLGLEILAEGVETNAQADFLRHAGCQLVQGYLYVPALPATQLEARWRATGMDIQTALACNRSISPEASRGSDNNQPCP